MNIALIGYGKMGHAIEHVATERGHSIVLKITSTNREAFTTDNLQSADVAIEFTSPDAVPANVAQCIHAGIPACMHCATFAGAASGEVNSMATSALCRLSVVNASRLVEVIFSTILCPRSVATCSMACPILP